MSNGYNGGQQYGGGYGGQQQQQQYGNQPHRDNNGPCTEKQAGILRKYNYNPNVSFAQASQIIDALKQNGWKRSTNTQSPAPRQAAPTQQYPPQQAQYPQGPPPQHQQPQYQPGPPQQQQQQQNGNGYRTDKQAACLQKFNYDPNVSFQEAAALIDELKANGWQRPDGQMDAGAPWGNQPEVQSNEYGGY